MKPLLKLLARLYPSAWHARYGAEFDALLEDRPPRLRDAFDILSGAIKMQLRTHSFLQITLACSLLGALIAAALSFTTPPQYLSQALILVNGSATNPATPPPNDFKPLLSILRTSTLDRDFLASLIQKKNLYPRERTRMPLNAVIDKMLHSITVKPLSSSLNGNDAGRFAGFVMQFAYSDPHLAQQVESDLVSHFVRQNLIMQANAASAGHPLPAEVVRVMDEPRLPQKPVGWSGVQKTTLGLFTGLLCGLILAAILRTRHSPTIANT
jgi:hypothetical protein